jgi:BppU N-terminal domain
MVLRQNDVGNLLKFQLRQGSQPVPIQGATITLIGTRSDGTSFGGACQILDAAQGKFQYVVQAQDTATPCIGFFSIRVSIGGTIATLPRYGNERLEILP